MARGGAREGAGRPTGPGKKQIPGLKKRSIRMTDEEYDKVRSLLKEWRKDAKILNPVDD
jgi:hypothetical protein